MCENCPVKKCICQEQDETSVSKREKILYVGDPSEIKFLPCMNRLRGNDKTPIDLTINYDKLKL